MSFLRSELVINNYIRLIIKQSSITKPLKIKL